MSSKYGKPLRISTESHEILDPIAQDKKVKKGVLVDTLVSMASEYHFFDPDWIEQLFEDKIAEYKRKVNEQLNATLEKEKQRQRLAIKKALLLKYCDALEGSEKTDFIERALGDINDPTFIDKIGEYEIVFLDGKRKLVKRVKGVPLFPEIPKEKLIACAIGYHVRDNFCECKKWRDCSTRVEEYVEYKATQSYKAATRRRRF